MTTIELINSQKCKKNFSFEVLPPLKGNGTGSLFNTIDKLKEFKPLFINITNHSSEYVYKEHHDGLLERTRIHRRPGTVAIAAAIQYKYNIPVMPHIICAGASRSDIEYELLDLQFLGIENLLVLRGDKAHEDKKFTPAPNGYSHATELIEQINQFNKGFFMDGSPIKNPGKPFDFGVACYPEKHEEAPNLDIDIRYLKQKQDLGAQYAVTQLFYDNEKYYAFPSNTMDAAVYDASNNSQTDKTINYLSDLVFTEGSLDKNSAPKAKYYFVINDYKYYIVSSKIFFEVTSNSGHLYTITSDKDFSDLF